MLKKYIPHHQQQQQQLGVLLDLTAIAAGKKKTTFSLFLPHYMYCTFLGILEHVWGEGEISPPSFASSVLKLPIFPPTPTPAQLCMSFGFAPLLPHYFLPLFFVTTAVVCPPSSSSSFSGKTASGCKREGGRDTKLLFGGEISIDIKKLLVFIASNKVFL